MTRVKGLTHVLIRPRVLYVVTGSIASVCGQSNSNWSFRRRVGAETWATGIMVLHSLILRNAFSFLGASHNFPSKNSSPYLGVASLCVRLVLGPATNSSSSTSTVIILSPSSTGFAGTSLNPLYQIFSVR